MCNLSDSCHPIQQIKYNESIKIKNTQISFVKKKYLNFVVSWFRQNEWHEMDNMVEVMSSFVWVNVKKSAKENREKDRGKLRTLH